VSELFAQRGWQPFDFQQEAWRSYLAGESGLIHAGTGMGKTWGAWLGPVLEALAERPREPVGEAVVERVRRQSRMAVPGLRVVWITPLRALAADTLQALLEPLDRLGLPWLVESRTSDTSASVRQKQRVRLPTVLVTTPESLTLLLTRPDAAALVEDLRCVIVDEWHELLGSKRGVQTELALARLRRFVPPLRVWGLSATLGNLPLALQTLLGAPPEQVTTPGAAGPSPPAAPRGRIIAGLSRRSVTIDSILPENVERFPWAGHLGLKLLPEVVAEVDRAQTSLIFTNTRSQTEQWYQALLTARPDWAGWIALHHGSLERETRTWVEQGLRSGQLKCVVCTSTLDLGVDFAPVERVFQVGSPKGIARLLQRAGRSGHAPGRPSRITCVPTHAWELVEAAAAREASVQNELECRGEVAAPLDVLTQHVVSMALAGGFEADALFAEIRGTHSYRHLDRADFEWVLDFVTTAAHRRGTLRTDRPAPRPPASRLGGHDCRRGGAHRAVRPRRPVGDRGRVVHRPAQAWG
jgi:ATP-dependent Lhr-like helicase